jgi:hypothetical protein
MNTSELFRHLAKRCQGLLLGIFAADRLPRRLPTKRPLLLVCNTDPHYKPGEHWIAMFLDSDGTGEYFDSFGRAPMPIFRKFLDGNCSSWTFNDEQLQSVLSRFCGHYCVFYCLFKRLRYSLNSIINCFSNDTMLNDTIVHNFVCENL